MRRKLSFFIVLALVGFLLLEFSLMLITKSGHLNIIMPTYSLNPHEDFLPQRSYIYGRRHLPNSTYSIRKNCLDVTFDYNALGFRDRLEDKQSKKRRFIVIGDSFVEGVGVNEKDRFSDRLENSIGLPFLNFGMADKGSTQSFLIYDSIASKFDHDAIIWTIFPTNDLIDDDPNYGKNANTIKPCWIGEYPNYSIEFVPNTAAENRPNSWWKRALKGYTYTYDALFYLKQMWQLQSQETKAFPKTGYFNYSQEQVLRLKYSIERMQQSAKGKEIFIVCIPSHLDLENKTDHASKNIEDLLKAHCEQLDLNFIGLYDLFKAKNWKDYYFTCDSHWNEKGHRLVAEYLDRRLKIKDL